MAVLTPFDAALTLLRALCRLFPRVCLVCVCCVFSLHARFLLVLYVASRSAAFPRFLPHKSGALWCAEGSIGVFRPSDLASAEKAVRFVVSQPLAGFSSSYSTLRVPRARALVFA
jgi:hypothetical protein